MNEFKKLVDFRSGEDFPEWATDGLTLHITVNLDWKDRLLVGLGLRTIELDCFTATENTIGNTETRSAIRMVRPYWWRMFLKWFLNRPETVGEAKGEAPPFHPNARCMAVPPMCMVGSNCTQAAGHSGPCNSEPYRVLPHNLPAGACGCLLPMVGDWFNVGLEEVELTGRFDGWKAQRNCPDCQGFGVPRPNETGRCSYNFKKGWYCTREIGHGGPCALVPLDSRDIPEPLPQAEWATRRMSPEEFKTEYIGDWSCRETPGCRLTVGHEGACEGQAVVINPRPEADTQTCDACGGMGSTLVAGCWKCRKFAH